MTSDVRHRFPGLVEGHARFDGPAGTLMVDTAIEAMRAYAAGPGTANLGGSFTASEATGAMVDGARATVAELLGASADQIVFGANMTTLTLAFTRAVLRDLGPRDEIVCTELDHDANVTPWVLAARDRGARVVLARLDRATARLPVGAIEECLTEHTRWVAVTGASNLLGTIPDVTAITAAAHAAGARVFVDAVHLAPHRAIDFTAIGCDALVTSPYKWYGPHAGVLTLHHNLLDAVEPYKVRPGPGSGPRRFETGTPAFEAIAAVEAAARFLLDQAMDNIAAAEQQVFSALLDGLAALPRVTVHGPAGMVDRTPTVLFSVEDMHANHVAAVLGQNGVATWQGDSYAVEGARALGLADAATGVGVRAGVVRYCSFDDVERILRVLKTL